MASYLSYSVFKDLGSLLRPGAENPQCNAAKSTETPSERSENSELPLIRALPGFPPPPRRSRPVHRVVNTRYSPISPSSTRASSRAWISSIRR